MLRLATLFIFWPLLELLLLIRIGQATSALTAILLVILPALFGAGLAKHEGLKTYRRIQEELAAGRVPGDQLIEGVLILIAGILLITPGLISDTIGLLLLVPPLRRLVREHLKRRFKARFTVMHFGVPGVSRPGDDFVDVQAHEVYREQFGQDAPSTHSDEKK